MARTMPIRLRSIAAACVVIASCLIIYNVYQSITGTSDESTGGLPIIVADAAPFRHIPENPGGVEIPNQDSRLFELLKTNHEDPLALDGVVMKAETPSEPETIFAENTDTAQTGFALPEVPETRTESLYGMIEDLKERDTQPSREPVDVVNKGFVKMDETEKQDLQEKLADIIQTDDAPETEKIITEQQVVAPVAKPKLDDVKPVEQATEKMVEKPVENIDVAVVPTPSKKPSVPARAKRAEPKPQPVERNVPREPSAPVATPTRSVPTSYYMQLASLRDEAAARQAYETIARDFPAVVAGVPAAFPTADLGARGVFTRIQIGPMSQQEAQRRCTIYTSSSNGGTCLVISR